MQCGGAVLVLSIDVGSRAEQEFYGFDLYFGVPCGAGNVTVRRIMQWAAAAAITGRVWIGSGDEQQLNYFDAITGSRQMKCRVAHVYPMEYSSLVELFFGNDLAGEAGIARKQLRDIRKIVIDYGRKKGVHECLTY